MHASSTTTPNGRLVWIDRDPDNHSLICIHHTDGHRVYRHASDGWAVVTAPIAHEPHDDWPTHELPTPQRTPAAVDQWLTIELASIVLVANGWY